MTSKKRCAFSVRLMIALLSISMFCASFSPAVSASAEKALNVTSTEELNHLSETGSGELDFSSFFSLMNGVSFFLHDEESRRAEMVSDQFVDAALTVLTGNDYLNIRETASEEAEIVGKLYPKAVASVHETVDGWTHITSGSVDGWVKSEYIAVGADAEDLAKEICVRMAKILPDGLKVRVEMDLEAEVLDTVFQNESYKVVDVLDQWVLIEYEEGKTGYVVAEYVDVTYQLGKAISIEEELEAIRLQKEEEARKKAAEEAAKKKAEEDKKKQEASKNEVKPETTQQAPTNATADEAYLLACICRAEGIDYEGMLAVANCVLNRVKSSRFPNTISEVIYQKNQFAVGTRFQKFMANGPGDAAIRAANDALAGKNNLGDYLFFRTVASAKFDTYSSYTIISGNCFYAK